MNDTAFCKKCGVEHDSRDVNGGVCVWCEQKENNETQLIQMIQQTKSAYYMLSGLDDNYTLGYTRLKTRG
jgi:hypothetical protein